MMYRVCGVLIASLGLALPLLAADDALARSGTAPHAMAHRHFGPGLRHHHRGHALAPFWATGPFYDSSTSEAMAGVLPPESNDVRFTYTDDVPWDWAHRYPPAVEPSSRPYVSTCSDETITVPGRQGGEHTVNVTRCY